MPNKPRLIFKSDVYSESYDLSCCTRKDLKRFLHHSKNSIDIKISKRIITFIKHFPEGYTFTYEFEYHPDIINIIKQLS